MAFLFLGHAWRCSCSFNITIICNFCHLHTHCPFLKLSWYPWLLRNYICTEVCVGVLLITFWLWFASTLVSTGNSFPHPINLNVCSNVTLNVHSNHWIRCCQSQHANGSHCCFHWCYKGIWRYDAAVAGQFWYITFAKILVRTEFTSKGYGILSNVAHVSLLFQMLRCHVFV